MAGGSSHIKNAALGSIKAVDGAGTELQLPYTLGDLKLGPLKKVLNEDVQIEARGEYISSATGKRIYPTLSFSALAGNLAGATATAPGTLAEFVTGQGAYAANVSTSGAGSRRVYTVKLVIRVEGSDVGDTDDEVITLNHCIVTVDQWSEAEDGNKVSITAKVVGTIAITNGSNTVTYAGYTAP